jgi:hypothetical protein
MTSIFRVEEISSAITLLLACWFLAELIFLTLKMEATSSFETSVVTQRTTRHYIPDDGTILECLNVT